jgi:hypothetical protein
VTRIAGALRKRAGRIAGIAAGAVVLLALAAPASAVEGSSLRIGTDIRLIVAAAAADSAAAEGIDPLNGLRTSASFQQAGMGRFWRTALDVVAVNEVIWLFNRYIREGGENPEFRKGWNSLVDNLKNGFEWDDNNFATNHFLHPYHGNLYVTAARSNGYTFWQAAPWAFMGSAAWEYFGEVNNPSVNDWINTAVGGMAFGEALFRMSDLVIDNEAQGSGRTWREIGGFLIAPARGFNRMVSGEAFEAHSNAGRTEPSHLRARLDIGVRTLGEERFWLESSTKAFAGIALRYGDWVEDVGGAPFDAFEFIFQLNFDDPGRAIGRIESQGVLASRQVAEDSGAFHAISAVQHFDYFDNAAFTFGAQSFSATHRSRFGTGSGIRADAVVHGSVVVLGASRTDYFSVSGREYDYGPGLGFKVEGSFGWNDRNYVLVAHEEYWINSINGNDARHWNSVTNVRASVPMRGFLSFDLEYLLYLSERQYVGLEDVSARNPELRAFLSWRVD